MHIYKIWVGPTLFLLFLTRWCFSGGRALLSAYLFHPEAGEVPSSPPHTQILWPLCKLSLTAFMLFLCYIILYFEWKWDKFQRLANDLASSVSKLPLRAYCIGGWTNRLYCTSITWVLVNFLWSVIVAASPYIQVSCAYCIKGRRVLIVCKCPWIHGSPLVICCIPGGVQCSLWLTGPGNAVWEGEVLGESLGGLTIIYILYNSL